MARKRKDNGPAVAPGSTANLTDALKQMSVGMNSISKSMKGCDSTFVLGTDVSYAQIKSWVSTTCVPLDAILWGGFPRKRVIELFGHPSEGKSTLLESCFLGNQLAGGYNVLILSEGSIDQDRMKRQGIDLDRMVLSEIDSFEEGVHLIVKVFENIRTNEFLHNVPVVIGWDSLSNSQEEDVRKTGNPYAGGMSSKARNIRRAMRLITPQLGRLNATLIFLSQTHQTIGQMYGPGFAVDGGGGVKFNASLRIWVKKMQTIVHPDPFEIGIMSNCKIEKSKCGPPPFREVTVVFNSFRGLDNDGTMYNTLSLTPAKDPQGQPIMYKNEPANVIHTSGSWKKLFGMPGEPEITFYERDFRSLMEKPGVRQYMSDACLGALPDFVKARYIRPIYDQVWAAANPIPDMGVSISVPDPVIIDPNDTVPDLENLYLPEDENATPEISDAPSIETPE
jgi:RecA/RadA recombinase